MIQIDDMEMPKSCPKCKFYQNHDGEYCFITGYAMNMEDMIGNSFDTAKPYWCPLREAQEPRVMTLEEIDNIIYKSSKDYERLFWAESRSKTRISFGVFQLDITTDCDYEALLIGCSWPVCYRRETYGIRWRCWTQRPTDEQREATPWQ